MKTSLTQLIITGICVITISVILNFSCKKSPTEPPDNLQPGRRDYEWTIDTLNYPYNTIYRIWGSSPTDVWATSPGGDLDKTIFHYDGKRWYTDGISRPISPTSIWGFSSKDIWIGGMNGKIWHFDGSNWKEITRLSKDGSDQIVFDNMWGESPNDFYAFGAYPDSKGLGNNSVIAQFNNNKWVILNCSSIFGIVENLYKNKIDSKIYLRVLRWGGGEFADSTNIYEFTNQNHNKIYSGTWDYHLCANISLINGEVYFVLGTEIAKRNNDKFQSILNVTNEKFANSIWGRSEKDIFLSMTDGLEHYNGSNIEYLFQFNKLAQIFGAQIFTEEVFFIVYEIQTNLNLIYHGKLNQN